jgi:hypothetical protein
MYFGNNKKIFIKEQISGAKNDHAIQKSPGYFAWVRALILNLLIKRLSKLMENKSLTQSDKLCF